ncbi:MAG: GTPase HflX [Bacteroides sp.]|nr:GTPase HflX [Eubacterium sp.]MCM1418527.1 GTPase HflX [Roseburia sp.]MCM1462592.1 GTPase HflX [Bacteroides sp.]
MTENTKRKTRDEAPVKTIIAALDTGDYDAERSLDELGELAATANAAVVARIVQKRPAADPATVLGEGKIEEMRLLAESLDARLIVFDTELTASEIRNIEEIVNIRVIDRTMLILDIFAARAVTNEGKLQVELAQLRYRLPRLAGIGRSLSRLGGGIGTRGPGEKQLETDRRHIRGRIGKLEEELSELTARRERARKRRKKDGTLVCAIVGYTNAGKSTLLNRLTGADVYAADRLFATLDPTSRAVLLPDGRTLVLVDTVGFIRRLPHHLVEAFKSTLEEAVSADILLHVSDLSDPEAEEKTRTAETLLAELQRESGVEPIPTVHALNKADLVGYTIPEDDTTIKISAKTGEGLDRLLALLAKNLPESAKRMTLRVPYGDAGFTARLRENGKVFSEEYAEDGIRIDALVEPRLIKKAEEYQV